MRRHPESFVRARLLSLYLISLAAVEGSLLAWRPDGGPRLLQMLWPSLAMAAAAFAGAAIHDRLAGLAERQTRGRVRSVAGLVYGVALFLVCMGLLAGEREAAVTGGALLRALQPAFLLLAGFGRGYLGTLVNAFALTAGSVLAGGPGAALSVVLHAGGVTFFLAADHASRKLTEYPVDAMPPAGPVLLRAGLRALAVAGPLAGFFAAFPPGPYAPLQRAGAIPSLAPDHLAELMANLLFIGIVSGLAFYLMLRWTGGRGSPEEAPVVRIVPAPRRSAERAGASYLEPAGSVTGWRTRIVELYLRTTQQLSKWGRRRRPWQTPLEFARHLAPEGPSAELADLFGRARYGSEDLTEADYERAARASREILDHHRRRP